MASTEGHGDARGICVMQLSCVIVVVIIGVAFWLCSVMPTFVIMLPVLFCIFCVGTVIALGKTGDPLQDEEMRARYEGYGMEEGDLAASNPEESGTRSSKNSLLGRVSSTLGVLNQPIISSGETISNDPTAMRVGKGMEELPVMPPASAPGLDGELRRSRA
mmetsp:Transcript_59692/g.131057  ORF Transcript_59692/g.131057 Transcript_59692/m.131057 type:complete len:161 (+) Transcript_59692:1-483(+)